MLKIVLLFLLVISFINRKRQPKNILLCGIWAWTGKNSDDFDIDKFNIQGIYNDERGGDSCGRVVDGIREIGIQHYKRYPNFITIQEYNDTILERTALGHARKASFGYPVNEANAQPVIIEEDGEITFSMCHNGTIYNIEDLAKKYGIEDITNVSDSMILAEILQQKKFDVLKEYQGAAALIMYDREEYLLNNKNIVRIFKGESKNFNDVVVEERPLHIYEFTENNIYIASLSEGLEAIGGDADSILEVPANKLITIEDGSIVDEYALDRKNQYSIKRYVYSDNHKNNDYKRNSGVFTSSKNNNNLPQVCKTTYDIGKEVPITIMESIKIQYAKLRYYRMDKLINGKYWINASGESYAIPPLDKSLYKELYFVEGVLMQDKEGYTNCLEKYEKLDSIKKKGLDGFNILCEFSKFPLINIDTNSIYVKKWDAVLGRPKFYNGTIAPFYSRYKYTIKEGDVKSAERILGVLSPFTCAYTQDGNEINEQMEEESTIDLKELVNSETDFSMAKVDDNLDNEKLKEMSTQKIAEIEAANEVAELLIQLSKTNDLLRAMDTGSDNIKTMLANLSEIEDAIVNKNFSEKTLSIKW